MVWKAKVFLSIMRYELPTPVQWALNRLVKCGHEAYVVGGCVRDMLLAREPHDWDVCTSASPREVIDCFADLRVVATGIKHGTVTALLDGQAVEITTYRVDGEYADHRRPDRVRYTASLRDDLARRDFTINAMAYRPEDGIIDNFGGQDDLRAGVIRCVGDPDARFGEDALRMLRALRFSSRFGFEIEAATADALLRHAPELRYVAVERVLSELSGMDYARIDTRFLPVLQVVVPELRRLGARPGLPAEPALRLASLLRGLDAASILGRLRASVALQERVALLVDWMETPVRPDDVSIRRLLRHVPPEAATQLFNLQGNLAAQEALERVLARGDAYSLRQLAVNGSDLSRMGLAGKQIGQALDGLLTKVIDGELPNDHDKLLRALGIAVTLRGMPD